ncbi:MAG TPA: class I SAM-dependent rRNA methyltransferase [Aggregatilineales bacterium]|nr:class I SAM-dependent rRNA methyltransferase [Chloroflexota bacterium]HOA24865.1 class I SAM-dependent rRNA methyltransferase [Aggregatilineales bacterium]HPV07568.1 class I SAM-dependent rRNA methyltransferase [Aggregatilineales bacterium]HQA67211.1 class I SAM-dependent rRNA methyltransferase [Aggregatilineales bacterium]HQE18752.1 class I SAM-dependent rRNA methyltransferase [Aggregatilineales bacterium]
MARAGIVILKQGREKPVLQYHPWVFSGAIDSTRTNLEDVEPGDIVEVRDYRGGFLARGYWNPRSQIRVRILTWDQNDLIGPAWWRVRMARAIAAREGLASRGDTDAYRLIFAESDGLPGLIVDRYGDYLVIQSLTLGIEVRKDQIVEALVGLLNPRGIYERSDADVRHLEGLGDTVGLLYGEMPPDFITIREWGMQYPVTVMEGHKTGFYLDQKHTRHWLLHEPTIAGRDVLNCFSYTGSLSACAAKNGAASITNVDTSGPALEIAQETMRLNGLEHVPAEYINADVFETLRAFREEERSFDLIILDPPKFAHTAQQVERASRGYKDINWLAFQLLRPGGLLMTYSCSGHIDPDLFQKIVFGASVDAGVQAQIVHWFAHPEDHPVLLAFPEARYLKGLVCRTTAFGSA